MTLAALQPGQEAMILKVEGPGAISRRMADMGVVPGQRVQLVRVAPLGDPLDIRLMGYHLSLRREEALRVEVSLLEA
jgi:Fe2+ transport system protein FeoA